MQLHTKEQYEKKTKDSPREVDDLWRRQQEERLPTKNWTPETSAYEVAVEKHGTNDERSDAL